MPAVNNMLCPALEEKKADAPDQGEVLQQGISEFQGENNIR